MGVDERKHAILFGALGIVSYCFGCSSFFGFRSFFRSCDWERHERTDDMVDAGFRTRHACLGGVMDSVRVESGEEF